MRQDDPAHPANRLYRGEAQTLYEALRLVMEACELQRAWFIEYATVDFQKEAVLNCDMWFSLAAVACYEMERDVSVETLCGRWEDNPESTEDFALAFFARAGRSGNYVPLS